MEGRVVVMTLILIMMMMGERGSAKLIKVGNSWQGWSPNYINFTQWASHHSFYVGDWIGFWYESKKQDYNVLEVNHTSYEQCIDKDFIRNVTGGAGRDVFNLTHPKTYYFLSGGGYCWSGLKIALDVRLLPLPSAYLPPSNTVPPSNTSPSPPFHVFHVVPPVLFCILISTY